MRWGLACCLLLACSPGLPASEPSPANGASAPTNAPVEILPVTSASAAAVPPPGWKAGEVLKHLPARCDYGRAYANLDELLSGGGTAELTRLAQKKVPLDADGQGLQLILQAFEQAGRNPYAALKEIGFCFDKAQGASVTALRIDLSGIEGPAEVLAKAIERKDGKPPRVASANGLVWLEHSDGSTTVVGENLVVVGYARDTVASGVGGTLIPPDFADAVRHVVWVRLRDKDTSLRISGIGSDLDLQIDTDAGPSAASMASSWQSILPQLETMMVDPKLAPLRPLLPAARRASIQASGERVQIATRMPKTVVREVLQGLVDSPGL